MPRSLSELRGFLGLMGYYRRFVRHFASIAAPLTNLLKSTTLTWSSAALAAFQELKAAMSTLPVLTLPDFSQPFDVTTDASLVVVGAVLSQARHPIAFFRKKMSARMQSASTYDREMFAITETVRKWRHYSLGRRFRIYTDQRSLRGLLSQTIQTPAQQKWLTKLLGFDYHHLGKLLPHQLANQTQAPPRVDSSFCSSAYGKTNKQPDALWLESLCLLNSSSLVELPSLRAQVSILQDELASKENDKSEGFDIVYTPGKENLVSDALSRGLDSPSSRFAAFTSYTPVLLDQLRDYFSSNPAGQSLLSTIAKKPRSALTFSLQLGLVYYT
ncbi:Retrovirus-related Pol polyprotein from transposon.6 [Sesamum alatum]|uniref:Retrovirus-related Pol polyprotein from transposon.6 n=1 Tax=Sesamum alatum TaxID=300844 RepID=A0AAE2C825_9LAMI|nr:Retrovirus-related Pol polyprotein from transposon.6 [Sesamum alatum]